MGQPKAMENTDSKSTEPLQHEQDGGDLNEIEQKLWNAVERLRINSGLKFDEYAKMVLGLIFLGYANKQATKDEPFGDVIILPSVASWNHLLAQPDSQIGDALNKAMVAVEFENQRLDGVLTQSDYNRPHTPPLADLLRLFSEASSNTSVNTFASFYEFFLDRFARASGERSGEFSTPQEIATLLIELVKPQQGMSVYDPCVGTAGFLREAMRYASRSELGGHRLSLFGQEINQEILSIGRIHLAVNGELDADLRLGNTLIDARHTDHDRLMQFDRAIANPPFSVSVHGADLEDDPFGRFRYGIPPRSTADFAFIQHMIAALKPDGIMAVVAPHGVLFRGGREGKIRQGILEDDLLEAIIGLPPALFYGTGISAAVLVINKSKPPERVGKVLFINADRDFEREGKLNTLQPEHIKRITTTFDEYADVERFSRVVEMDEIRANSFNLNIPRYADSSPLAGLVTQYDNFAKHTIKELAVEVNRAKRGGEFEDKPNSVYVPMTGKRSTDNLEELGEKHDRYYQVVLNEQAINSYVAQFLGTSVGQHALSVMTVGSVIQRLSKDDLHECIIAVPDLETQQEIVTTHRKLSALKAAINEFDQELSLNPTGLTEFQKQLDSMLSVIGGLSEADHLRSIIRQGESKTVEFKETFSLDLKKETKEKYIEEASLKTVVAFLNSDGGILLVGVSDDEKIVGIDAELKKFHKDVLDKFLLHFKNTMRQRVGEEFYPFINYQIAEAEERRVLVVECKQAERPCFLDEKVFYVRTNPATDKLEGTKQYEYIKHRFGG
ncbi:N-6 DNA methylase [Stieleria varia]|uniref:site-specific DNA-methyltransferase (adenine-specific) n=1 Tax=Stieleria varia TaxID=2528005 RepID=A0A5C6B9H8_9BACT|nr:N-6 DNA methylase [Stieleria varia]TWU08377.1 Type I restriction enzyme EcoKI M protein [Stieleria varia]